MQGIRVLLMAAALAACERAPTTPSALLITMDTTRADARVLGTARGRSPALDALAQRGILYESAHTVAPLTLVAHASMLTGLVPPRHGIRDNGPWLLPQSARTLAEAARERGYRTAAFVAAVVLDRAFGLDQGFETYSGPESSAERASFEVASLPAREVIDRVLAWLDARDRSRPFFLWVHLFDPHQPYDPPPGFMTADLGSDTYLGEIASMDHEIGRLMERLERDGLLATTAILAVGDHGEALGEHGEDTHGFLCYEPTLHVPFLLVRPDGARAGERSRAIVSVADVAPTLAEVMGATLPLDIDGTSLWSGDPPGERGVYFESYMGYLELATSPLAGWLDGSGKYLESSAPEFYRLASDPLEATSDLAARSGATARPSPRCWRAARGRGARSTSRCSPGSAPSDTPRGAEAGSPGPASRRHAPQPEGRVAGARSSARPASRTRGSAEALAIARRLTGARTWRGRSRSGDAPDRARAQRGGDRAAPALPRARARPRERVLQPRRVPEGRGPHRRGDRELRARPRARIEAAELVPGLRGLPQEVRQGGRGGGARRAISRGLKSPARESRRRIRNKMVAMLPALEAGIAALRRRRLAQRWVELAGLHAQVALFLAGGAALFLRVCRSAGRAPRRPSRSSALVLAAGVSAAPPRGALRRARTGPSRGST
jgi:hypothetical protein